MSEDRLIDLEMKITHQELLIEQLSKALYQQQMQLDQLDATLKALGKRLQNGGEGDFGPANEKPPHY
jgi:SlyX protein